MNAPAVVEISTRLFLKADTAADLMAPNPQSIHVEATIKEAVTFLADKGFSAAPVIDEAGRAIGVLSRSDILIHDREQADYLDRFPEYYRQSDLTLASGETLNWGIEVEKADYARVGDIMTPMVFSVTPETAAQEVIESFLSLKVHHLFVVDKDGILVGVISTLDVLRHLSL
jgi:CBS-domain-containing membrane protein